ncbi:MAG: hypothetical protein OXG05_03915 [Gammaproteobacteria bacterium]|nr:hypothetical protein [Gammaproteobacteria bacterium]
MSDSTTPIIVGIAQIEQRTKDLHRAKEPIDLMLDALHAAAADTGNPSILGKVRSIRVSQGQWQYGNPARFLADEVGLNGVETGKTVFGGNGVQTTVNLSCLDIQQGNFDVIAMTGAECGYSQANARRSGQSLTWRELPGTPDWTIKFGIGVRDPLETNRGIGGASQMYAVIENAIRHDRGESIDEHRVNVSKLWSRFNDVAQHNPNAWIKHNVSAKEIRTEGANNRPIAFPYPKFMNANNNVDQGAALLLCSVSVARQLGIPESKWVYPWAGTDGHDTQTVSHRAKFTRAPGLRTVAERVLELTELNLGNIAHFDLYSCFPSAVQVAAKEIGLDLEQPLTVTGGLTFGGGPLNNYVMHAIARMVELLREQSDKIGMVTGNGGILTKHAHGIYSSTPPSKPFLHQDVQALIDTSGNRVTDAHPTEAVEVEGYTVLYDREAPIRGVAACLTVDGKRTWGYTTDRDLMHEMQTREFCGRNVRLDDEGVMNTVA